MPSVAPRLAWRSLIVVVPIATLAAISLDRVLPALAGEQYSGVSESLGPALAIVPLAPLTGAAAQVSALRLRPLPRLLATRWARSSSSSRWRSLCLHTLRPGRLRRCCSERRPWRRWVPLRSKTDSAVGSWQPRSPLAYSSSECLTEDRPTAGARSVPRSPGRWARAGAPALDQRPVAIEQVLVEVPVRRAQVLEQRVGVVAGHLGLGEHRELHPIVGPAELAYLLVRARLLAGEVVRREPQHHQPVAAYSS